MAESETERAPRRTADLLGHAEAEKRLLDAWRSGRMPHGWLFAGPAGIGKATLAYRFARFVLAGGGQAGPSLFGDGGLASLDIPPEHPVFRRVAAGGHPDLMTLEREIDPKKDKLKTEIAVDQVRDANAFLHLTPAEGGWRVLIVDTADEMSTSAQNALLKTLEEPSDRALLLLVSHAPGRLPATIRSRCCRLDLRPLPDDVMSTLIARYMPDLKPDEAKVLLRLGDGSIGRAVALDAEGGIGIYSAIEEIADQLPDLDLPTVHAFADKVGRSGAERLFETAFDLLQWWLARVVRAGAGAAPPDHTAARLLKLASLDRWVEVWEKIGLLAAQTDGVNLDRKQVALNAFYALEQAARNR
jgi:DNA polymerase-3 subunit delta'